MDFVEKFQIFCNDKSLNFSNFLKCDDVKFHAILKAIISAPETSLSRMKKIFRVETPSPHPFYHRCNKRKIYQNEKWFN